MTSRPHLVRSMLAQTGRFPRNFLRVPPNAYVADCTRLPICRSDRFLERFGPGSGLADVLRRWAAGDPRPLVPLIDEIDALRGDSLIAVLRQLGTGYPDLPHGFPLSIVLCGLRDHRDYRISSGSTGEIVTGGSSFNISAGSLRLGDFSQVEGETVLGEHTAQTGKEFRPTAIQRVWKQTCGQP